VQSFDRVARQYDATRGLSPEVSAQVGDGIAAIVRTFAAAEEAGRVDARATALAGSKGTGSTPRVLEVGIGTGRIAVPLERAGVEVFGVDIAREMLAQLHAKRPGLPVARAVADGLPFGRAAFDAALFVHILHLVPDARAALRAAASCLRSRGVVLLGLTDFAESPRHIAVRWIRELATRLAGVELPSPDWNTSTRAAFRAFAAELGTAVTTARLASWQESWTGRQLLDGLRRRLFSSYWAIPEQIMPELVQRLTPRVEELCGGLDRPVSTAATFSLEACPVGTSEDSRRIGA
jgi:SAM-dependent methyltransferase